MFATLSANSLLKHSFKQSDMTQIRALEATKKSKMVENMPSQCMTLLTEHLTEHYHAEGGKDDPANYTNFMLRLMQRPFLLYDPELFSEVKYFVFLICIGSFNSFPQNVQTEVSALASLQFTNLPEAAALLYKYEGDWITRHTTSASFVGSVQVFIEAPGVIYTRAR